MDAATALIALAAFGFQWGYQPAGDGTIEYMVQLRPEEARYIAESGEAEIVSYVPAEAQPIGRIRISVGEGTLPREQLATGTLPLDRSNVIDDPHARPAGASQETGLRETQARVAVGQSPTPKVGRQNRYNSSQPAEGPAVTTADSRSSQDQDLAGRLVQVPPFERGGRNGNGPGSLQLTPADGGAVAAGRDAHLPKSIPRDREHVGGYPNVGSEAATGGSFALEPPAFDLESIPKRIRNDLTSVEPDRHPARTPTKADSSPSDRDRGDLENSRVASGESDDATRNRPWLPMVSTIAIACGFLAGNVFQWRSYLSLRKRYLHLIRTTGG